MANKSVTQLDFDAIKANLIEYLSTRPEFSDYDFTGSALNTLMDVLSYNTHYNAFYVNMLYNEAFLDTAIKRSSVVAKARMLGYKIKSATASNVLLNVICNNVPPQTPSFIIERGTIFNTAIDGVTYDFIVTEDTLVQTDGTVYIFPNLLVKEGTLVTNVFTIDGLNLDRKVVIPNKDIDISTLKVYVQEDETDAVKSEYITTEDIYNVSANDRIYFVEESMTGEYEIYFGNGIIGRSLLDGNVVTVEYLVTNKAAANGARSFALVGTINGFDATVIPNGSSFGGSEKESIESIKFNAPKEYARQNRTITATDYEVYLRQNLPNLDSVVVWGGEDNEPPQFGKVFISLKPIDGFFYSNAEKNSIIADLVSQQNVITIRPEFVDPYYIDVSLDIDIRFDKDKSTISRSTLLGVVNDTVVNYFNNEISKFGTDFVYSKLVTLIDKIDTGIIGNYTEVRLVGKLTNLTLNTPQYADIRFLNETRIGSVTSTIFKSFVGGRQKTVYIKEDSTDIRIDDNNNVWYKLNLVDTTTEEIIASAGQVNHKAGNIQVTINPSSVATGETNYNDIVLYAEPVNYDILRKLNYIVRLNSDKELGTNKRIAGVKINIASV